MTRTALEGFGRQLLETDEVVMEATGNCTAVFRVLSPCVARVVIANPLQGCHARAIAPSDDGDAIAHAHVKTDKVDAGTLASLHAAGYLPQIWTKRRRSGCAASSRAAIRSSGIGRGSGTRCMPSCTRT